MACMRKGLRKVTLLYMIVVYVALAYFAQAALQSRDNPNQANALAIVVMGIIAATISFLYLADAERSSTYATST